MNSVTAHLEILRMLLAGHPSVLKLAPFTLCSQNTKALRPFGRLLRRWKCNIGKNAGEKLSCSDRFSSIALSFLQPCYWFHGVFQYCIAHRHSSVQSCTVYFSKKSLVGSLQLQITLTVTLTTLQLLYCYTCHHGPISPPPTRCKGIYGKGEWAYQSFLPRGAMRKGGILTVGRCLSVRPSVWHVRVFYLNWLKTSSIFIPGLIAPSF